MTHIKTNFNRKINTIPSFAEVMTQYSHGKCNSLGGKNQSFRKDKTHLTPLKW